MPVEDWDKLLQMKKKCKPLQTRFKSCQELRDRIAGMTQQARQGQLHHLGLVVYRVLQIPDATLQKSNQMCPRRASGIAERVNCVLELLKTYNIDMSSIPWTLERMKRTWAQKIVLLQLPSSSAAAEEEESWRAPVRWVSVGLVLIVLLAVSISSIVRRRMPPWWVWVVSGVVVVVGVVGLLVSSFA